MGNGGLTSGHSDRKFRKAAFCFLFYLRYGGAINGKIRICTTVQMPRTFPCTRLSGDAPETPVRYEKGKLPVNVTGSGAKKPPVNVAGSLRKVFKKFGMRNLLTGWDKKEIVTKESIC